MSPNQRILKLLQVSDLEAEKLILGYEKDLIKAYSSALKDIKQMIAEMFEKYGDQVTYKDMVAYQRLTNLELGIAKQIKTLTGKGKRTVEKAFRDIVSESFSATGTAISKSLEVTVGFGVMNEEVIKTAILNPMQRITWSDALQENSAKYLSQIKTELSQGLIKGEGYAKIAKRLEKSTEMSANKTIRIVRTEGHRAQSVGRKLAVDNVEGAADRLGIKIKRVWVATSDDRTRDSHKAMDGKEADDDGLFTLPSGVRTEGPGMSGVAEEDINCRCTVRVEVV
ncbi:MAG: hypothetical protein J0L60_06640 [Ignavibacteria bacterium]|nr:hypothetical protein [Ignavibacteria bacterium]